MFPWQSKVHSTCTAMSEKQIFLGHALTMQIDRRYKLGKFS